MVSHRQHTVHVLLRSALQLKNIYYINFAYTSARLAAMTVYSYLFQWRSQDHI